MLPKVSVLWLNYNSMHLIDVTIRSLGSLFELDYPNYEIIVLDNNSSDGSDQVIKEYIKNQSSNIKVKFLKTKQNNGFAGGMNAAYNAIGNGIKYVALTHNDLIVKPDCLKTLIEYCEAHPKAGAVQGIVAKLESNLIVDSAGFLLNESLDHSFSLKDEPVSSICKPSHVTYVEGTMPIYNVNAVRSVLRNSRNLFVPEGFVYYLEDVFLSLMLWNGGYECIVVPTLTGEHYRMATSKKMFDSLRLNYFSLRNHIALLYMTNSVDKWRFIIKHARRVVLSNGSLAQRKLILKALFEGLRIGRQLRLRYGAIDLYRAPLTRTSMRNRLRF